MSGVLIKIKEGMQDADWEVRYRAVEDLLKFREIDDQSISMLTYSAFNDEEPYVREIAVRCLGRVEPPVETSILKKFLYDDYFNIHLQVAEILGARDDDEALGLLLSLRFSEVGKVWNEALWRLRKHRLRGRISRKKAIRETVTGDVRADDVSRLALRMYNWFDVIRPRIVNALGKTGSPRALPYLCDALKYGGQKARKAACLQLRQLGDPAAIDTLLLGLKDEEAEIRTLSMWALIDMGEKTVAGLLEALQTPFDIPRHKAARTLASMGETALGHLKTTLTHEDKYARLGAVEALGMMENIEVTALLKETLRDEFDAVRITVLKLMGERGQGDSTAGAAGALKDGSPEVRLQAVATLEAVGSEDAVTLLLELLDDDSPEIRREAMAALARLKTPRALEPLLEQMGKPNVPGDDPAIDALGILGDKRAAESLFTALKKLDNTWGTWAQILRALARLGDARVLPLLANTYDLGAEQENDGIRLLHENRHHFQLSDKKYYCTACRRRGIRTPLKKGFFNNLTNPNSVFDAYYACGNCNGNLHFFERVQRVVLVFHPNLQEKERVKWMREQMGAEWLYVETVNGGDLFEEKEPKWEHKERILVYYWKGENNILMDYDEIRIHEADNYGIEKMVMAAVINLPEEKREGLKSIPVIIQRNMNVSPVKVNLLKEYFNVQD